MNDAAAPPPIDSRTGFVTAIAWGLQAAIARDARCIFCVDADFAVWPLDDTALLQTLGAWLRRPQRRLVLLARHYDEVPRCFPRFVAWRRDWAHAIDAWQAPEELAATLPTLLLSDGAVSVQLIDSVHWRGRAEIDARRARLWRDQIDVVLQRSTRSFAVNTLGL